MDVVRPQSLAENVAFIDGFSGCGISLVAPVLSSLDRGELWLLDHKFEYFLTLAHFGEMKKSAAKAMIRLQADTDIYNLMIARNTNFRVSDDSSAAANLLEERYRRRLSRPDGDAVTALVLEKRPILYVMTHFIFDISGLLFEAMGARMKAFVLCVRHHLWLIDAWYQGRWDERIGRDGREFQLCYERDGSVWPWCAFGWEEEYSRLSPLERSIRMVARYIDRSRSFREELSPSDRDKVVIVPFEPFAEDPGPYLERLSACLETAPTEETARVLEHVNVPRVHEPGYLEAKKESFEALAKEQGLSPEGWLLVQTLCEDYENAYLEGR